MDLAELEHEIEELEQRVERLRSLYEQYFLGIEKIEPLTARKDVDRRIWVLRREQIRNTRKRFRLQTIIQRYNTYQQYWMRINREIEAGTYRRHLIKAQKILETFNPLTYQARKRHRMLQAAAEDEARADHRSTRDSELPDLDVSDVGDGLGAERDEAFARLDELFGPSLPPSPAPQSDQPSPRRPRLPLSGGTLGTIDLDFDAVGGVLQASTAPGRPEWGSDAPEPPTPRRVVATGPPGAPPSGTTAIAAPAGRPLPPPGPGGSLRASPGFSQIGPPAPRAAQTAGVVSPAGSGATDATDPRRPAQPIAPSARPDGGDFPARLPPPARTRVGLPPPAPGPDRPSFGPPLRPDGTAGAERLGVPASSGRSPVLPAGAVPPQGGAQQAQAAPRPPANLPPVVMPTAPRVGSLQPPPKPRRPQPSVPDAATGRASPLPSPPADPPLNVPAVPTPFVRAAPGVLTDDRVQAIHARLVEAKRRTADANIPTLEGLKRSLLATQEKLRKQHGSHRTVEFEVVIKDGKAVLKPVVR